MLHFLCMFNEILSHWCDFYMDDLLDQTYLQLYLRESKSAALLDIDALPSVSEIDKTLWFQWIAGKRAFTEQDVIGQTWLKAYPFGDTCEIYFKPDGTLEEFGLFRRSGAKGKWAIVQGLLCIEITKNGSIFKSKVVANYYSNIHSSIEYKDETLYSYQKLMPIKTEKKVH